MTYENRLKIQENVIYITLWTMTFLVPLAALILRNGEGTEDSFSWADLLSTWKELLPFLILFLVHNFAVTPFLFKKQQRSTYFIITACLLVMFATYTAALKNNRPRPQGPPPTQNEVQRPPMPESNNTPPDPPKDENGIPMPPKEQMDRQQPPQGAESRKPEPQFDDNNHSLMGQPVVSRTLIALLLIGMNLGIKEYFRSIKGEKDMEELRRQHLEQELEYLRYQINPHFFMNTLNNIHALVDIDPEQAKSTIVELSRLMRYVLYDGSRPTIPLVKETEFLQHYIALMRLRYSDSVRIEVDIPEEIPDVQVPPLLFISFVENAFKHGISYQSESFIMTSFNVRDGFISFSCINSKHETNQDPHSGIGLENTQKRLKLLYQDNYTFNINENNKTYEVLLKIPVSYDQMSGD